MSDTVKLTAVFTPDEKGWTMAQLAEWPAVVTCGRTLDLKRRDLERHLTEHGCRPIREGARHTIWANPARDFRIPGAMRGGQNGVWGPGGRRFKSCLPNSRSPRGGPASN